MVNPTTDDLLAEIPWLRRFAAGLVRSAAEADDLVQDTLDVALRREPNSWQGPKRSFLGGIARNLARAARRGRRRRGEREVRYVQDSAPVGGGSGQGAPAADDDAGRLELLRALLSELGELPSAQRRAITSRFLDELTPADIAARDGVTASTVRAQIARGLAALRDRMDRRGGREEWLGCLGPWAMGWPPGLPPVTTSPPTAGAEPALAGANHSLPAAFLATLAMKTTLLMTAAVSIPALLFGLWWFGGDDGAGGANPGVDSVVAGAGSAQLVPVSVEQARTPEAVEPLVETAAGEVVPAVDPGGVDVSTPVVGYLVDMLTGEPVPGMGIEAFFLPAMQRYGESFRSDASGRVVMDPRLFPGATELRLLEGDGTIWGQKRSTRQSMVPFPFEGPIPVHVGPTFRVALPEDMLENFWALNIRFRALDDTDPGDDPIASFREGDMPWIRFPRAVTEIEGGPFELVIRDRAGLRIARVPVTRSRGIEPEVLRPEFEQRGAVKFTLSVDGEASAPAVRFNVEPLGHVAGNDVELRGYLTDHPNGSLSGGIQMLPEGEYRWSILSSGHQTQGRFEVVAGHTTEVALGADVLGATFDSEVLIDASGAPGAEVTKWFAVVTNVNEEGSSFETRPVPVDGAPSQYRIPLKALGHGTWRVAVQARGSVSVTPESILVTPGAAPEVLRVKEGTGRASLSLPVGADITGTPIQARSAAVVIVPTEAFEFVRVDPNLLELATDNMPLIGPVEVFVRAPGYQGAVVVHDASKDPAKRVVRMTPGWRNRVLVVDVQAMAPAVGVSVHADGKKAGVTDASGWCWLEGDAPPLLVEVAKGDPKFEVVGSSGDGRDAGIDPVHGFIFQVVSN